MARPDRPHDPAPHYAAAARHEDAARRHEDIAGWWDRQGDVERVSLHREMARYERWGAELERRWAALIERESGEARDK
jgi:hypothetical protein